MSVALFSQLLAQVGLPLAIQLRQWYVEDKDRPVSDADITQLVKMGQYRSTDALAAAGISIVNGKVVNVAPGS